MLVVAIRVYPCAARSVLQVSSATLQPFFRQMLKLRNFGFVEHSYKLSHFSRTVRAAGFNIADGFAGGGANTLISTVLISVRCSSGTPKSSMPLNNTI